MTTTLPIALSALVAGATVARVYRGGTTLNDHAVAGVVTGCVGIYPILWFGAVQAGLGGVALGALGAALALGGSAIYGLFHVLDGRRDPGPLIHWARFSQLAYAFSLWTGLLLVLRTPAVLIGGGWLAELAWPGPWLLIPLALAGWGTAWTWLRGERVVTYDVPHAGLARPLRLVHLSDLHVGPTMRRVELDRLFAKVNALDPDLVLLTGDLLMPFSEAEHGFLIEALRDLRAPTIACPGNHDLPVLDTFKAELASAGVPMLVDEAQVVEVGGAKIEVVGVDFRWTGARAHLLGVIAALPRPEEVAARVLLAHDPRLFKWLPAGRFELVLSGHTHGGQVGTDMFGLPWSVLRPLGVHDQGWWKNGGALQYVHRGNWFAGLPPRMGIAGEIVLIRLGAPGEIHARPARLDA